MSAPEELSGEDAAAVAVLSNRLLRDMVATLTPDERQRYRDALEAADPTPNDAGRYQTLRSVLTDDTGAGAQKMTAAMVALKLPMLAYPTPKQLDAMMDFIKVQQGKAAEI